MCYLRIHAYTHHAYALTHAPAHVTRIHAHAFNPFLFLSFFRLFPFSLKTLKNRSLLHFVSFPYSIPHFFTQTQLCTFFCRFKRFYNPFSISILHTALKSSNIAPSCTPQHKTRLKTSISP